MPGDILDARIPGDDAAWRRILADQADLNRRIRELAASVGRFGQQFTTHGITISGGGSLGVTGDAHIGGLLTIDGNTTIGGTLTLANGIVDPNALSQRSEGRTFGGTNTPGAASNTFLHAVTVSVPAWATSTSCIAMSTVYAEGTGDATRIGGHVTIAGNVGPDCAAISYISAVSVPMIHRRDFTPAGGSTFTVTTSGGASPVSATAVWTINTVVMCVFSR